MSSPNNNLELNRKEKRESKNIMESNPVRISMNLTGRCNIRCVYCHLAYAKYYTKEDLTPELFTQLTPFLESASYLVYFSSTEPLAARHFVQIFKDSAWCTAEKYLSTNGILMSEDIAEMFVKDKLCYLTVSIAGTTRETFEYYHGVDAFDRVIENINRLNKLKKRYGSKTPRMRLVFVTMKSNLHLLPDAVKLAHELECSEGIKITYLKAYTKELLEEIPYADRENVIRHTDDAMRIGEKLNVPINLDGGNYAELNFNTPISHHRMCYEPFERFHIEADGKVRPCPCLSCNTFAGDLKKQTLEEIWNGEVYRYYREVVNTPNPPDGCNRCTHNFHKDFTRRDIWDLTDFDLGIYKRK